MRFLGALSKWTQDENTENDKMTNFDKTTICRVAHCFSSLDHLKFPKKASIFLFEKCVCVSKELNCIKDLRLSLLIRLKMSPLNNMHNLPAVLGCVNLTVYIFCRTDNLGTSLSFRLSLI